VGKCLVDGREGGRERGTYLGFLGPTGEAQDEGSEDEVDAVM